jgi:hypothetical protein
MVGLPGMVSAGRLQAAEIVVVHNYPCGDPAQGVTEIGQIGVDGLGNAGQSSVGSQFAELAARVVERIGPRSAGALDHRRVPRLDGWRLLVRSDDRCEAARIHIDSDDWFIPGNVP